MADNTIEKPIVAVSRRTALRGTVATAGAILAWPAWAQSNTGTVRVVAPWEYTSNEPSEVGFILARMGIAETLVQVEVDGKLVGGVAESWTIDADKLTWRFPIRSALTFHDGTPVTAAAVAGSLKLSFGGESLSAVPLDSVAADGNAVVIKTKTPFSVLPAFLVDYSAIILAPASFDGSGKVQKIIATGPYKIGSIDGKTTLELKRFEGARVKAASPKARYTAVPNGDTRANIAIAGDADLVFTLAPTAVARINSAGQMKVESLTIPRVRPIAFNSGLPQFEDVRVRRAISMAVDRAGIAQAILRHPGSAATQLLPPVLSEWHNRALPPIATDVPAAKKLLDETGWVAGADGVRAKGGVRLAAKLLTIANRPELPPMAAALQEQLKQIGMEITIDAGQASAIPGAIKEGRMEMAMFARTYVNVPDVIATIIPDFTRERSNWGTVNWPGRTKMKQLADEYVASFDETRKAQLRTEITRFLHEDVPVIPVAWFEHTVAVSVRSKGAVIDPFEMRYFSDRVSVG